MSIKLDKQKIPKNFLNELIGVNLVMSNLMIVVFLDMKNLDWFEENFLSEFYRLMMISLRYGCGWEDNVGQTWMAIFWRIWTLESSNSALNIHFAQKTRWREGIERIWERNFYSPFSIHERWVEKSFLWSVSFQLSNCEDVLLFSFRF